MSFFRASRSPASKAAYSRSTRAAFGCSNIPIASPHDERRSAVLVLKAFAQPKGGHFRAERVLVPDDLRAQDLRIILQVALEIGGTEVEVEELAERGGHGAT